MHCSAPFFLPNPFQRLWSCSLHSASYIPLTPPRIYKPKQEQSFALFTVISYLNFRSARSFLHLPCPQKNYTARQKHTPALRLQRRLPPPSLKKLIRTSFRFSVRAICVSHPRSARRRLASLSLRQAEKALRFATLLFHLPSVGSGLLYLLCFSPPTPTPPDHPPHKTVESQ